MTGDPFLCLQFDTTKLLNPGQCARRVNGQVYLSTIDLMGFIRHRSLAATTLDRESPGVPGQRGVAPFVLSSIRGMHSLHWTQTWGPSVPSSSYPKPIIRPIRRYWQPLPSSESVLGMNTAESQLSNSHSPLRDEQMPPISRWRDELTKGCRPCASHQSQNFHPDIPHWTRTHLASYIEPLGS